LGEIIFKEQKIGRGCRMVDVTKELRRAVDSGKVVFGFKQAKKEVLKGSAQLIVISSSGERYRREAIEHLCKSQGIPFQAVAADSMQLGSVCGKPFPISFACVEKPGKSKILDAVKQQKQSK